jgi:hypothetical protein
MDIFFNAGVQKRFKTIQALMTSRVMPTSGIQGSFRIILAIGFFECPIL